MRPFLDASEPAVRVSVPALGTTAELRVTIAQRSASTWLGFADPLMQMSDPILHTFDVRIERECVTAGDTLEQDDDLWEALRSALWLDHATDLADDEAITIARVVVAELPVHIVEALGGWYPVTDEIGDTAGAAFPLLAGISDRQSPCAGLTEGAVIWPRRLGVHPRLRGQALGLRLLVHALWVMYRSIGDVALLQAVPIRTWFDSSEPVQDADGIRALRRYYSRVGFRLWRGEERPAAGRVRSIMYLPMGERGIMAKGLYSLSSPAVSRG